MTYIVFNQTDGVPAAPAPFKSKKQAQAFCVQFRRRFAFQGYYLTARMQRIDPADIELQIIPCPEMEDLQKL